MSIIDSILNVFLGDKGKKDVKEVSPIVAVSKIFTKRQISEVKRQAEPAVGTNEC